MAQAAVVYNLVSEVTYDHFHILLVTQTNSGKMVGALQHWGVNAKSKFIGAVWERATTHTLIMKDHANFNFH